VPSGVAAWSASRGAALDAVRVAGRRRLPSRGVHAFHLSPAPTHPAAAPPSGRRVRATAFEASAGAAAHSGLIEQVRHNRPPAASEPQLGARSRNSRLAPACLRRVDSKQRVSQRLDFDSEQQIPPTPVSLRSTPT